MIVPFSLSFASVLQRDHLIFVGLTLVALALAAFSLTSYLWSADPFRVFRPMYGQAYGFVVLLAIARSNDRGLLSRAIDAIVIGALISAIIIVVAAYVKPLRSVLYSGDRTAGFFRDSNQLGIVLAMSFPIVLARATMTRRPLLSALLASGIMYLGLTMAGSKTNLVLACLTGSALVLMMLAVRKIFTRAPHIAAIMVIGMSVAAVGAYFGLEVLNPRAHRVLTAFAEGGAAPSLNDRAVIHEISIEDGMAHPWGGVGAGQRAVYGRLTHSHNVLIDYFRCLGVPGLALIMVEIALALWLAIKGLGFALRSTASDRGRIMSAALALSIISYIAANQMSDSFGPSTLPFMWIAIGLLFRLRHELTVK